MFVNLGINSFDEMHLESAINVYTYINPCLNVRSLLHVVIVRNLMFWYSKQELCIKWFNETSSYFTISNVICQGGILSPVLLSIYMYMDDLSVLFLIVE